MEETSIETPVLVELPVEEGTPAVPPSPEVQPSEDSMGTAKSVAIEVAPEGVPESAPADASTTTVSVSAEDGTPLFTVEFYAGSTAMLIGIILAAVFKLKKKPA
jgi:hypothetical protein